MDVPRVPVEVFEPRTAGSPKYTDVDWDENGNEIPRRLRLPTLHLYEDCPGTLRAIERDGDVLRSRGYLEEVLAAPPRLRLCGKCARRVAGGSSLEWWWEHGQG